MHLPGMKDTLDGLRDQLADAIRERDHAVAVADAADAKSKLERLERNVSTAYSRAQAEAERVALVPVQAAEQKLAEIDGRLAAIAAEADQLRAARVPVEDALEDAEADLRDARTPFLDPESDEAKQARTQAAQHRERLQWHVRHPARDRDLSRRELADVKARREQLQLEAQERAAALGRYAEGTLAAQPQATISRF